jgi:hypothetical protein
MAMPIVDFQLSKIAIDGKWKTKPIQINLAGSMMLDNSVICFDPSYYYCMDKDKNKDLEQCEEAWNKKITGELMKCGIKTIGHGDVNINLP